MVNTERRFDSDQALDEDRRLEGLIDGYIVEAGQAKRDAKKILENAMKQIDRRLGPITTEDHDVALLTIAYCEAYQTYRDILDEEIHARRGQVMRHQKQRYYERTGYYYGRTDAEIDD